MRKRTLWCWRSVGPRYPVTSCQPRTRTTSLLINRSRHDKAPTEARRCKPSNGGIYMEYASLQVLQLEAGGEHTFSTGGQEMVLLPLAGSCRATCDGETFELAGRDSVFSRVTDFAYLPRDS